MTSLTEKLYTTFLETFYLCQRIGEDSFGNIYYERKAQTQRNKRWVLYKGRADGSKVPPLWHAWLHHTVKSPPSDQALSRYKNYHLPNMSGTPYAYTPKPTIKKTAYEAWTPEKNQL